VPSFPKEVWLLGSRAEAVANNGFRTHLPQLTHFWLRWKQATNHSLEPFADGLALLDNGFPQPDFSRTYGLSHRHKDLRNLFMPHVQHILKRYHQLRTIIDQREDLLLQLATLFLNASDTPQELRPIKQRVRTNLPGTERALPQGRLVDRFEQDVTFLETLEEIITRLQYPAFLFFRAVHVFFEHTYKVWSVQHPRAAYRVQDIKFAGQNLVDIRNGIHGQIRSNWGLDGQEDLVTLMPLMADPGDAGVLDADLDQQSGLIGFIGEFTPLSRTFVF